MRYSTVRLMHNKKLPLPYYCAGDAICGEQLLSCLFTLTPPDATEGMKNLCLESEHISVLLLLQIKKIFPGIYQNDLCGLCLLVSCI